MLFWVKNDSVVRVCSYCHVLLFWVQNDGIVCVCSYCCVLLFWVQNDGVVHVCSCCCVFLLQSSASTVPASSSPHASSHAPLPPQPQCVQCSLVFLPGHGKSELIHNHHHHHHPHHHMHYYHLNPACSVLHVTLLGHAKSELNVIIIIIILIPIVAFTTAISTPVSSVCTSHPSGPW